MTNRQEAREAWHEAELLATATFTWPVQEWREPKRPDPSKDPQYPYWRGEELAVMHRADMNSPAVVEYWKTRADDFNPDHHARRYVLDAIPPGSGEGAIYTPEYLTRKEGDARGADPHRWRYIS